MNGGPRVAGTLDAPECRLDRAVVGTFVLQVGGCVDKFWRGMGFCERVLPIA